jgi:hypothetical protein
LIFILLFSYSTLVGININKSWGTITYSGYASLYHLGAQSPSSSQVKSHFTTLDDVPSCILSTAPYFDVAQSIKNISQNCPESHKYISEKLSRDLIGYYLTNPKSLFNMISIGYGASFSTTAANYGNVVSILPSSVYGLINGSVTPDLRNLRINTQADALRLLNSGEPVWVYIPGAIWIGMSLFLFLYRSYSRKREEGEGLLVMLILFLSSNAALNYALVPTEWVRLSMPNITFAIMIAVIHLIYVYQKQSTKPNFLSDNIK